MAFDINLYSIYVISKMWSVAFIVTILLLSHISSHVIHLFSIFSFLYLNFSSILFSKKKKKKNLFFSLLIHTYYYIFSNIFLSFLSLYLLTNLNFTVTPSSSFLYFDSSSPHFILYKFDIIFPYLVHIFLPTKLWVLSL